MGCKYETKKKKNQLGNMKREELYYENGFRKMKEKSNLAARNERNI